MLIAAQHKKDRNIHRLVEDEVTSAVFGPLVFMDVIDIWALFSEWLPIPSTLLPPKPPADVKLEFWKNLRNRGRVEPDFVCRFMNDMGETLLSFMFEVKWNAGLSGDRELVNQWSALSSAEKERTIHIYLVKRTAGGEKAIENSLLEKVKFRKEDWRARLFCVGWRSLIATLRFNRPHFSPAMNLWADATLMFFRRCGLIIFTGFQWLEKEETVVIPKGNMFWNIPPWFSSLKVQDVPLVSTQGLFWSPEQ